jgi:hypothetical protein
MNNAILSQWEEEVEAHLPCLNSWQVTNVAQMSNGVMKAEGSQQQKVARKMRGREKAHPAFFGKHALSVDAVLDGVGAVDNKWAGRGEKHVISG